MNRTGLGLAIGAGYLLGRTKKLKMAVAVGGLVAGRKLNLSPRMVAELVSQQMRNNPQFKELGDQLRGDLRGVGKAASGALVERQLGSLADRLHGRTAAMRDELTGGASEDAEQPDEDTDDDARQEQEQEQEPEPDDEGGAAREEQGEQRRAERPAKKAAAKKAPAKKAPPAKKAAKRTPPAKKTAAKKTAAASRGGRSRTSKGGGER